MTLLALLIALGVSRAWPDVERWRRTDWLAEPALWISRRGAAWAPAVVTVIAALVAGGLLAGLADLLLGEFGQLLAGTAVVLLVLGPRDLDRDVDAAASGREGSATARLRLRVEPESSREQGAAAVLHAALARWFGVLFWFAVLGIPGAVAYRSIRVARHLFPAGTDQRPAFDAVLGVLNWPAVALMTLSIALMTDFDRVLDRFDARADRWRFPARLLDDLAKAVGPGVERDETDTEGATERATDTAADTLAIGLRDGRQLALRVLALWLAVVALLLLIGVIA